MSKIEFSIAIPTYNRLSHLKKAIDSIKKQIVPTDVNLTILISNIASSDKTSEYLDSIKSEKIIINNQPFEDHQNSIANFYSLSKIIPEKTKWVWLHGDDDYITDHNALSIIISKIRENDHNLKLITACQGNRFNGKQSFHKDTIFNLCNNIGYHEILGWISGLILEKNEMRKILENPFLHQHLYQVYENNFGLDKKYCYSAYPHAMEIYKNLSTFEGIFINHPLINTQEKTSEELKEHNDLWEKENVALRYLFIIDDFLKLEKLGIIKKNSLSKTFFRYQVYHLWDHLLSLFLLRLSQNTHLRIFSSDDNDLVSNFTAFSRIYWEKVLCIEKFLKDKSEKKYLNNIIHAAKIYSNILINSKGNIGLINLLSNLSKLTSSSDYRMNIVCDQLELI